MLDLAQLPALDFDELRTDLFIRGIDGGVNVIADDVLGGEFAVAVEIAIKGFAERIAASDEPRVQSKQSVFAGHETPPGVRHSRSAEGCLQTDGPANFRTPQAVNETISRGFRVR